MALGEIAGLAGYDVPLQGGQQFIQRPNIPVTPMGQAEGTIPPMEQNLAYIKGLTDEYHKTYGRLKGLVTQMNAQGIDITRPDYTDESRMELYNQYKNLEANTLVLASKIKQSEKQRQEFAKNPDFQFSVNPNEQSLTDVAPNDAGFDPNDQLMTSATKNLQSTPNTAGDVQRQTQYLNGLKQHLGSIINDPSQPPVERQKAAYQLKQLTAMYRQDTEFRPQYPTSGNQAFDAKQQGAETFIRQLVNMKRATGGYDQQEVRPDGSVILKDTSFNGYGYEPIEMIPKGARSKIIIHPVIKDSYRKDGRTYLRFEPSPIVKSDGTVDTTKTPVQPPDKDITDTNTSLLASVLFNNNKEKIGMNYNEFLGMLNSKGLIDNKGQVKEETLLKDPQTGQQYQSKEPLSSKAAEEALQTAKQDLQGQKIFVANTDMGNLKITRDPDWFGSGSDYTVTLDGEEKLTTRDIDKALQWLHETNYLEKLVNTSGNNQSKSAVPKSAADQGVTQEMWDAMKPEEKALF